MNFKIIALLFAEFLGSLFLAAIVIGSGIAAEQLSGGSVALALLANTLATGAGLVMLIYCFSGISGAHFNPLVSLASASAGHLPWRHVLPYSVVQVLGCLAGAVLAHLLFQLPLVQVATHARTGVAMWLSEAIATFALVFAILRGTAQGVEASAKLLWVVPMVVMSGYWYTPSTSFANPAITIARGLTATFAGISMGDVPGFIAAQCVGALLAIALALAFGAPQSD